MVLAAQPAQEPLLLFALVLAFVIGATSLASTIIAVAIHRRARRRWGALMAPADLSGRFNATESLIMQVLLRDPTAALDVDGLRDAWQRLDLEEATNLQQAGYDILSYVQGFISALDDLPMSSFATIPDHADELLGLLYRAARLQHLLATRPQPK